MTEEEAKKFYRRGYLTAIKMGFSKDAEDIAQEMMLGFIAQGPGRTVNQGVIDAVRKLVRQRGPVLVQGTDLSPETPLKEERLGVLLALLKPREHVLRALTILRFRYGYKQKEIADIFGWHEVEISRKMAALASVIKRMD